MTVLFYLLLSFRWFATLQKQCGSASQLRGKGKPSAGLIFKGVVSFFLLKF